MLAALLCACWPSSAARAEEASASSEPATARESPTHRLHWRRAWGQRLWPELVVGGTLLAAAAAGQFGVDGPRFPRWSRVNRFDAWVQRGLGRGGDNRAVVRAATALWHICEFWSLAVDAVLVTWIVDRNTRTALHLLAMDLQSLSLGAFTTAYSQVGFARRRPERDCSPPDGCGHRGSAQSFISGHTAMAFTGASLICLQHRYLPLYGGGWPDALACGLGLAASTTTGILRLSTDSHWASDVIAGAAAGFAFGWLVPWLQHFRHGEKKADRGWAWIAFPWGSRDGLGATFALRR